ncbi:hypothetical protein ABZV34_27095 [Streptomyces sp. NPDC005195]|uniref:hypothetical protein n=1 Tax=Streptomyces sp. NPDC005195 TaxID=3154561 RepID=UPI0033AECC3B
MPRPPSTRTTHRTGSSSCRRPPPSTPGRPPPNRRAAHPRRPALPHAQRLGTLPGKTLVVLSRDASGNGFSPLSTYTHHRYSPVHDLSGEIYPLHSALAKDKELRELYPDIPDDAVAALVLYPLG